MEPRIEVLAPKRLVGVGAPMSLAEDSTPQLWQSLMPRLNEIANRVTREYVSMRVYDEPGMPVEELFSPATTFEKWAAVEVSDLDTIPVGLRGYFLSGGLYAVFTHRGPASTFPVTMRRIFTEWLPASEYALDGREHFEVLQEDWKASDPNGQEQIWIPIRRASRAAS
jgi:AraC family transcriptional regulator